MKRHTYIKYFLFLCIAIFSMPRCFANNKERNYIQQEAINRKICQLVELMPHMTLPLHDTIMKCKILPDNKSLIICYNKRHEIEHLGISLFSQETKQMLDESVCNFLERFFLELLLQKSNADINRKLTEYHIKLMFNGISFEKNENLSVFNVLQNLTMPVGFALHYQNKYGIASWNLRHKKTLSLLFPMSAELINGMDKKEADNKLYNRFIQIQSQTKDFQEKKVDSQSLTNLYGNIFVKKGTSFLIPSLNSDIYYEKQRSTFKPLFASNELGKSLKTLFHTYTNGQDVKLLITHRQYGHFTPEIEVPLNNFLAMFEHDFELYTTTNRNKRGEYQVMVLFQHKILNIIHLLRVKTTKDDFTQRPLVMKADFYSNIPQHYIKSLFSIK